MTTLPPTVKHEADVQRVPPRVRNAMRSTTPQPAQERIWPLDDACASAATGLGSAIPNGDSTPASTMDAAILGASPAFEETLHVGKPNMPDRARFLARMEQVFDGGRLTNFGPQVLELEAAIAQLAGTRYCVSTCNATVALELAVAALGMRGEVIVPSFTFVATAHALWRQGVRPVFCDIDPRTHCLDPACVEAAITPRTTGILAVHLWGNPGDTAALQEVADRHGLKLLYDAAHALGCATQAQALGSFGNAAVFSLHATKVVHAFEGGAIVTDDTELAARLRLMTNFGFIGEDDVRHLGTNGKMSEVSAAMGLTSLESMRTVTNHNARLYEAYARGIADVPGVSLMPRGVEAADNYHYIVVEVDAADGALTRDELVSALRLENVMARRYFHPGCHRMQPYRDMTPPATQCLPVTEAVSARVMILPAGLALNETDVQRLTRRMAALMHQPMQVREALGKCKDPRLVVFDRQTAASASPVAAS